MASRFWTLMFDVRLETEKTRRDSKMGSKKISKSRLISIFENPSHGQYLDFDTIFELRKMHKKMHKKMLEKM